MKIYPFNAVLPNLEKIPTVSDAFFDTVKEKYTAQKGAGMFQKATAQHAFYLYRLDTKARSFWGVLACADILEYVNGNIKKHENTIVSNEQKQSNLLAERGAAIKPVLLAFAPPPQYAADFFRNFCQKNTQNAPTLVVPLHETHSFWKIDEKNAVSEIEKYFDAIDSAYIADGHHRCAASALLFQNSPSDRTSKLFAAFFPVEELKINEFNRLLTNLNKIEKAGLIQAIKEVCHVLRLKESNKLPSEKFKFSIYVNKKWYHARWREEILNEFIAKNPNLVLLDVHLLNEKIFKEILNIKNIRRADRIKYVEGTRSPQQLAQLANQSEAAAFVMYPVAFDDLKTVSDTNGTMPPKSTFFEPRMKNGLVVYEI